MRSKYLILTKEQVDTLAAGKSVEVFIGKKIKRTLTTKSLKQMAKEQLQQEYEQKMKKLEEGE